MSTNVTWNGTTYAIPAAGEVNWPSLSNFLLALGNSAATTATVKQNIRVALTTPVTVAATTDYIVVTDLTTPGAVAVNLPAGVAGQVFAIVDGKFDAGTNNITVNPNGAETIAGAAGVVMNHDGESLILGFHSPTNDWKIISNPVLAGTITNADIAAAAAIDLTKLAATTADKALVSDGSGFIAPSSTTSAQVAYLDTTTSDVQVQLDSKLLISTFNSYVIAAALDLSNHIADTATHGATGSVVGTTNAQTLANKTLTSPVLNGTISGTGVMPVAQGGTGQTTALAAFNALDPLTTKGDLIGHNGTDSVRVAVGVNGQVLKSDSTVSAGVAWADSSSGGSGRVNYVENPNFESAATGWAAYADAAAAVPVDGTGGSPNVTITRSATLPLSGTGSGLITKDAANRQGQGVSYLAAVPSGWQVGRKGEITFLVDATDANYVAGDLAVYVYDVTNATIITPTVTAIPKLKGPISVAWDQTTASQYRLIFHVASTNATAWTVKIDDVVLGPGFAAQGAVVGPATIEAVTWNNDPGLSVTGSYIAPKITWQRVGESMDGYISFRNGTSTASNNVQVSVRLPQNLTVNGSLLVLPGGVSNVGIGQNINVAGNPSGSLDYYPGGTGTPTKSIYLTTGNYTVAASESCRVRFRVPIAEWAGSGTLNTAQNDVEYVSNSGGNTAAGSSDTTNFAYGPGGNAIGSIDSVTAASNTRRRIRFPSPAQSTDELDVEVDEGSGGLSWISVENSNSVNSFFQQGTSTYGIGIERVNSTDYNVVFGNKGTLSSNATYAGNGATWASVSTWRFRVVKKKAGVAVGFGLATATESGLVQKPLWQRRTLTTSVQTFPSDVAQLTFSGLTIGRTYRVSGMFWFGKGGGSTQRNFSISIRDAVSGGGTELVKYNYTEDAIAASIAVFQMPVTPYLVFTAATTTMVPRLNSMASTNWFLYGHGSDPARSFLILEELNDYDLATGL